MTETSNQTTVVELTFKRIQQFLFKVPRLKAMVGANACLGETIRNELLLEVKKYKYKEITKYKFKPLDDPLNDYDDADKLSKDNPERLYNQGVISRDGGHFTAVFKTKSEAKKFIQEANKKILEKLPGIIVEARLKTQEESQNESTTELPERNYGESPNWLPHFFHCPDTGEIANNYDKDISPNYRSAIVDHLEKAGDRFKYGSTKDIIGLLKTAKKLSGHDQKDKIPQDLSDLAGSRGYIAVIHADGNNIGQRRKNYIDNLIKQGEIEKINQTEAFNFSKYLKHEAKNEEFFHSMRVAMRASVVSSLKETFEDSLDKHKKLPYQLLMLGGDDLLIITRPEYAFPFVVNLSKKLKKYELSDDENMSIGAGVVIAHHNVPFYHLHHLAENLASSAKKLFRQQEEQHSVVDWMVSSNSWIDDVEENRRLYDLSEDGNICITGKPYFVLDDVAEKHNMISLQTLWGAADEAHKDIEDNKNKSDEDKLPRSKLKGLLQLITTFEIKKSNTYFKTISPLPKGIKSLFKDDELWQEPTEDKKLTRYKDLLELIELHYLGRSDSGKTNDHEENKQSTTGGGK